MWWFIAILLDGPSVIVECNPPDIVVDEIWRRCF